MINSEDLVAHAIVITEKILITFTLFYFICNVLVSLYNLQVIAIYMFIVSFFFYLQSMRKLNSTSEHNKMYSAQRILEKEDSEISEHDFYEQSDKNQYFDETSLVYYHDEEQPASKISNVMNLNEVVPFPQEKNIDKIFSGEIIPSKDGFQTTAFCSKCTILNSKYTRHCSICDSCLISYHHCAFLNNCVSESNKNDYFFFLFFLIIGNIKTGMLWNLIVSIVLCGLLILHSIKRLTRSLEINELSSNQTKISSQRNNLTEKLGFSPIKKLETLLPIDDNLLKKTERYSKEKVNSATKNKISQKDTRRKLIYFVNLIRSEMKDIKWKYVFLPWLRREIVLVE